MRRKGDQHLRFLQILKTPDVLIQHLLKVTLFHKSQGVSLEKLLVFASSKLLFDWNQGNQIIQFGRSFTIKAENTFLDGQRIFTLTFVLKQKEP